MGVELLLLYNVCVATAVLNVLVTARLEDQDSLGTWYRLLVYLYDQVKDVTGDGRKCGSICRRGWFIKVPVYSVLS